MGSVADTDGILLRSREFTWAAGTINAVDLNFLGKVAGSMVAPEIADLIIQFTGTVGAITGGVKGRDAAKLVSRFQFADGDGLLVDASGASLRVNEQIEMGSLQVDPTDIASGSTNTTFEYCIRIPYELMKSKVDAGAVRDYRVPLVNILEAGFINLGMAAALPTGWNTAQADWRFRVLARVVEGRVKQANARLKLWDINAGNREFDYDIGGRIRSAVLTSVLTTTGHTDLTSYTSLNSRTLNWEPNLHRRDLRDRYRAQSWLTPGTNDESLLAAPGAIPLVAPDRFQKIGAMPNVQKLHFDMGANAPAGGVLFVSAIVNRTPRSAARALGFASEAEYLASVARNGRIRDGKPGGSPVTGYDADLARHLPIRMA